MLLCTLLINHQGLLKSTHIAQIDNDFFKPHLCQLARAEHNGRQESTVAEDISADKARRHQTLERNVVTERLRHLLEAKLFASTQIGENLDYGVGILDQPGSRELQRI